MNSIVILPGPNNTWLLQFDYNPYHVSAVKQIGGARFFPKKPPDQPPHWRIPATLDSWDAMVRLFGHYEMAPTAEVVNWVKRRRRARARLQDLSRADEAALDMLPELHPELHKFVSSRGYQMADIRFMAEAPHPLNCNEPGTGKTVETIGAIYEAGLDVMPVLVIAPYTALEATWGDTLADWVGVPVATSSAAGADRAAVVGSLQGVALAGQPCWLVVNPEAIKQNKKGECKFPWVYDVEWGAVVVDEFHKMGLNNPDTLFYKSVKKLKAHKRILLSGTPMGGKPIKLWGPLNFLHPEQFSSKWAFINNWLQVYDNGYGKDVGDVKRELREEFSEMMAEFMVRRIKSDIMKWLPEKQHIVKWVRLEDKQKKQYDEWEQFTEIEIEDEQLSATSILSVYTRLRQFANAVQEIEYLSDEEDEVRFKLQPTEDSAKLRMLWDLLEELGIPDHEGTEQVVIFSQFTAFINVVAGWLRRQGVELGVITGQVKGADRAPLVRDFQAGKFRVMLMNTNAGGVSITLDRADTVIFLDETWNPDDQTQAEDRCHRGTKDRQVTVYKILAKDTIDEYVFKGNISKETINQRVLNRPKADDIP